MEQPAAASATAHATDHGCDRSKLALPTTCTAASLPALWLRPVQPATAQSRTPPKQNTHPHKQLQGALGAHLLQHVQEGLEREVPLLLHSVPRVHVAVEAAWRREWVPRGLTVSEASANWQPRSKRAGGHRASTLLAGSCSAPSCRTGT